MARRVCWTFLIRQDKKSTGKFFGAFLIGMSVHRTPFSALCGISICELEKGSCSFLPSTRPNRSKTLVPTVSR